MIVEEIDWKPKRRPGAPVEVKIEWGEVELGRQVKQAGGKWDPTKKVWVMRYDRAVELGLEERITTPEKRTGKPKTRPEK